MNENQVDARGLSCPQPVVLAMRAIQAGRRNFEVLLDSTTAVENVTRLLLSKGYLVNKEELDGDVVLRATR